MQINENDGPDIDFGTDELNDPQYEQKVQDDGTLADTAPNGETVSGGDEGAAPKQEGTDTVGGGTGADGTVNKDGQAQQRPAGSDTLAGGQQQQPAQQQQQQQGRLKSDAKGNLVDKDGNVVAAAGGERRQFERVQAQERYITRLEGELDTAKRANHMAQALNEVPSRLGLDMRETELGLQAIASFKKDPISTARWMLQETMRMGYNLQQVLGQDAQGQVNGGSLDLAAVKSMIGEALQPIVADRNAQQQQTQAQADAQREYEGFIAKHDHANVHEDVLSNMLAQDRTLTPETAYWQLREYSAKHQLDFTQPLRAQMQAREQGGQQQQQQQQPSASNGNANPQAQQQQQQPMPNGGAPTQDMQQQGTYANADDAWDSIVRDSLREAGIN